MPGNRQVGWWENHPKIKEWYEMTVENGNSACHPIAAGAIGFGTSVNGYAGMIRNIHSEIGFNTGVKIAVKASNFWERYNMAFLAGNVYCTFSYVGGGLDALYQQNHHGMHIGMTIVDWFIQKKNNIYNWWDNDDHWWQHHE